MITGQTETEEAIKKEQSRLGTARVHVINVPLN